MAEEAARLGSGAARDGDAAAPHDSALAALPLLPPLLGAPALRGDVICAPLLANAGALLSAAAAAAVVVPEDAMVRLLRPQGPGAGMRAPSLQPSRRWARAAGPVALAAALLNAAHWRAQPGHTTWSRWKRETSSPAPLLPWARAQAGLVALAEALGEQVDAVLAVPAPALAGLAAALAAAVAAPAAPPDARFACLKLLCDATLARLCCAADAAGAPPGARPRPAAMWVQSGPPWWPRGAGKPGRAPAARGRAPSAACQTFQPALW